MKHFTYYTRRPYSVAALHWTEDTTLADLSDFCDGLVIANDVAREFKVYNVFDKTWRAFGYGDWVVDEQTGLTPMSHERFMRLYEQDSDGNTEP